VSGALAGRTAVVTGSLGRLGPTWAEALAAAGANVAGVDLAEDGSTQLRDVVAALDEGGEYLHLVADVRDRAALGRAREAVEERWGSPTVLVCSAGIDQPPDAAVRSSLFEDVDADAFRRTLDVNLVGTLLAIQVFGPPMVAAGGGSIITIGSIYASLAPDPALYDHIEMDPPFLKPPAYGASKAGVVNLTRYVARLWGRQGVRANTLSPGGVLGDQDPEFRRKYCARVALGRMAEPEDLAGALVFLASDESRYVTGTELRVDGGLQA
jgi:NAD(P)-dependent dehydrogenase (short-subunit alcohol dehydrogenase family)